MTPWRVALYWAPERDDPLHVLGSAWLGRDAETGAAVAQPLLDGLDIAEITADARGYALHGTLKPPFRMTTDFASVHADAERLAAQTKPFGLPPLSVQDLHGFLALRETTPCPALHALADACVEALDAHRAPPTQEEIARRRPERLSDGQRAMLSRWGYQYVFAEWQFHVTLTRRLAPEEKAVILPAVTAFLGDAPSRPRTVRELCLFAQPTPGAPFTVAARLPLRG